MRSRADAHRRVREVHGYEASRWRRSACSWSGVPARDFATVDEWREFLTTLYPEWAVEIGVALFGDARVVLDPDRPLAVRSQSFYDDDPDAEPLDLSFFGAKGAHDGRFWVVDVPSPLPDDQRDVVEAAEPRTTHGDVRARERLAVLLSTP